MWEWAGSICRERTMMRAIQMIMIGILSGDSGHLPKKREGSAVGVEVALKIRRIKDHKTKGTKGDSSGRRVMQTTIHLIHRTEQGIESSPSKNLLWLTTHNNRQICSTLLPSSYRCGVCTRGTQQCFRRWWWTTWHISSNFYRTSKLNQPCHHKDGRTQLSLLNHHSWILMRKERLFQYNFSPRSLKRVQIFSKRNMQLVGSSASMWRIYQTRSTT